MINIDILTCLPELLESPLNHSIIKNAKEKKLVKIEIHDLKDYSNNKHKKVAPQIENRKSTIENRSRK